MSSLFVPGINSPAIPQKMSIGSEITSAMNFWPSFGIRGLSPSPGILPCSSSRAPRIICLVIREVGESGNAIKPYIHPLFEKSSASRRRSSKELRIVFPLGVFIFCCLPYNRRLLVPGINSPAIPPKISIGSEITSAMDLWSSSGIRGLSPSPGILPSSSSRPSLIASLSN